MRKYWTELLALLFGVVSIVAACFTSHFYRWEVILTVVIIMAWICATLAWHMTAESRR